MTSGILADFYY